MDKIIEAIHKSVGRLTAHPDFGAYLEDIRATQGDVILVNNSFLYRSKKYLKTVKNDKYLGVKIADKSRSLDPALLISKPVSFNIPFKRFRANLATFPETITLKEALHTELENLGKLIFILIGQVEDTVAVTAKLSHGHEKLREIVLDPHQSDLVKIEKDTLSIREFCNEETIWIQIVKHFGSRGNIPNNVTMAIRRALDHLQSVAVAKLIIPGTADDIKNSITGDIVRILEEQRKEYAAAFKKCGGDKSKSPSAYHDLLRIAYNFSSDAITYINLIISICDLKPIILWGTIDKRFELYHAIKKIPWECSFQNPTKPSLYTLRATINDARNSDFHDMFPFRKTLEIELPDGALKDANLRIFSLHDKRADNQLTYQDKELVDVLTQFTRARYRVASSGFWKQNLEVMKSTIELFEQTRDFLKIILGEIGS